jgi:hypothetical protein
VRINTHNSSLRPKKESEIFETEIATLWLDNEVLYLVTKKTIRTEANLRATLNTIDNITKGKKICLLSEVSNLQPYDPKVPKDMLFKELGKYFKAMAFVSCTPLGKMTSHVHLLRKHSCPAKFFENIGEATEWLEKYK